MKTIKNNLFITEFYVSESESQCTPYCAHIEFNVFGTHVCQFAYANNIQDSVIKLFTEVALFLNEKKVWEWEEEEKKWKKSLLSSCDFLRITYDYEGKSRVELQINCSVANVEDDRVWNAIIRAFQEVGLRIATFDL